MTQPDLVSKLREALTDINPFSGGRDGDECLWCRRDYPKFCKTMEEYFLPEHHQSDCQLILALTIETQPVESLLGLEGQAAQEALCGTAPSATISTNEAGRRTAMDVSPSEELLSRPHRIVSHEQMESILNAPEPNVTVNPDGSCSPSTPIVPGTAGLSAEQVRKVFGDAQALEEWDPEIFWNNMAQDLNALLGAAKPAEPEPIYTHFDPQTHVVTVIPVSVEARIRKDVLEEAAQLLKYCGYSANLVDEIRALAERPAPAGEVTGANE